MSNRSTARVVINGVSYRVLLHLLVHLDMPNASILCPAATGLVASIAVVKHEAVTLASSVEVVALLLFLQMMMGLPVGEHFVTFELVHDFIAIAEVCGFLDRGGRRALIVLSSARISIL